MSRPRVSVLIPARDAERTIGAALESVVAESFADWEIVLVDDGSSDPIADIVDPRVRLLRTAPRGIVAALNTGLEQCRGELIARFDADDLMHRDRLQRQVEWLDAHPEHAAVGSMIECFPRETLRDGMRRYEAWQNELVTAAEVARARFVESPLVHPSVTLRASVLRDAGGWRDVPWAEDWDLWLRLMESGHQIAKVPELLHFWRDAPARLTRTDSRYSEEALVAARAHFLMRGPLRERSAVIWGAGPVGKALSKALEAEGARIEAFIDVDPRKIGQRVHGKPVLDAEALQRMPGVVLLAAVGAAGARDEIRAAAQETGFIEGENFWACA